LLLGLLYPFEPRAPRRTQANDVRWARDEDGIDLPAEGILRTARGAEELGRALVAGDAFSLEVWLRPRSTDQLELARIVTYSFDTGLSNFTLGQYRRTLMWRLRTSGTDRKGRPALKVFEAFARERTTHVVVTCDRQGTAIFVDGVRRLAAPPTGSLRAWRTSFPLAVGNEPSGDRPWQGRMFLLALYGRPLSEAEIRRNFDAGQRDGGGRVGEGLVALYRFREGRGAGVANEVPGSAVAELRIPETLRVGVRPWLALPLGPGAERFWTRKALLDAATNVALFLPVGFLFHGWLRGRGRGDRWLLVPALVLLFALLVESAQYFVMTRVSSASDVATNTLGSWIGVALDRLRPRSAAGAPDGAER
jgi:hypothetical protein